ncbi:hypothetical protein DSL72_002273 [Monilinia vaccinii-corymbosi]|uniref:Uncharacterized protein n=1 Tax=Monilinia vaccinii-corymbosi TaxID=61207 RepID=A0A8A3PC52_9HELO|nr:hypothetical protein DSL72_002273 [Monilinia vaccinii-corymbosi]
MSNRNATRNSAGSYANRCESPGEPSSYEVDGGEIHLDLGQINRRLDEIIERVNFVENLTAPLDYAEINARIRQFCQREGYRVEEEEERFIHVRYSQERDSERSSSLSEGPDYARGSSLRLDRPLRRIDYSGGFGRIIWPDDSSEVWDPPRNTRVEASSSAMQQNDPINFDMEVEASSSAIQQNVPINFDMENENNTINILSDVEIMDVEDDLIIFNTENESTTNNILPVPGVETMDIETIDIENIPPITTNQEESENETTPTPIPNPNPSKPQPVEEESPQEESPQEESPPQKSPSDPLCPNPDSNPDSTANMTTENESENSTPNPPSELFHMIRETLGSRSESESESESDSDSDSEYDSHYHSEEE